MSDAAVPTNEDLQKSGAAEKQTGAAAEPRKTP